MCGRPRLKLSNEIHAHDQKENYTMCKKKLAHDCTVCSVVRMETTLINKYGMSFIVFANLWELERAMTAAELAAAREIRMRSTAEIGKAK